MKKHVISLSIILLLFFFRSGFSQITVLSENFNSSASIPTGWTQENVFGNAVWSINNGGYFNNNQNHPSSAYSGSRNAFLFSQKARRKLVSPPMNLSGKGNVQLNFHEARLQWGSDYDTLRVFYKTSSSGNWVQLNSYNSPVTNWRSRTISLPNPSSTYYIAFEARAHYGYGICIDDVTVTASIAYDAGVENIRVDDKKDVMVQFKNWGANTITSLEIHYQIDNNPIDTFYWTGSVASGQVSSYTKVGTTNFSHGLHTIKSWTSNPDNQGDGDNTNDTLSYDYMIINYFPYAESFESGAGHWEQPTDDNMNWTRKKGATLTQTTGPGSAYDGIYYYYMESSGNSNKTAYFVSPDIDISKMTNPYLEFYYHMYGSHIGEVHVDVDTGGTAWITDIMQPVTGNQGNQWFRALVPLDSFRTLNKIRIRGKTGNGFLSDIAFDNIRLLDIPSFSFGNDTGICPGNTITLSVDTGYGYTFLWIDTISNDTLSQVNHANFDTSGTYYLRVDAPYGYYDEDTINISFFPSPVANFGISDTIQCLNINLFNYTNLSTLSSGSMSYIWELGDDSIVTTQHHSHTYRAFDTFEVKLTVSSDLGCIDSVSKTIYVPEAPSSAFQVNDPDQCLFGNSFIFTDQTAIISSSVDSVIWDFRDGNISIMANPVHTYQSADSFNVEIISVATNTCRDTFSKMVYVRPMPASAFISDISRACKNENQFVFSNNSTIAYGALSYEWDFGDNSNSTQTSPTHKYSVSGNYQVELVAISNFGCTDTFTRDMIVLPSPSANFSVNTANACLLDNQYQFSNNSYIASGSMEFLWDFGDLTTDTTESPSKSFTSHGSFEVKLIAISDSNCIDSISQIVSVFPMPEADFDIDHPEQCFTNNSFSFQNKSSIPNGNMTYLWKFGDEDSTQKVNPVHSYSIIDTYLVKLVATSNQLCRDTVTKQIIVHPEATARFTINDSIQCFKNNEFYFENLSTTQVGTLDYKWYFGNDSSIIESPYYHAQQIDTIPVTLYASNPGGCLDSFKRKIIVLESPNAVFSINDSDQCLTNNNFVFSNHSTDSIIQNTWDFGDGLISFNEDDSNTYLSAGNYNVTLKVVNEFNCPDSISKGIIVYPSPDIFLGKDTMIHTDQSLILDAGNGFLSYNWNTGADTQSIIVDGSQTGIGTFDYWVEVVDQNTCSNSDTIRIEVKKSDGIEENQFNISLYPNPTDGIIFLHLDSRKNENHEIFVYDLHGRILFNEKYEMISGKSVYPIDLSTFQKGLHILSIFTEDHNYTYRVVLR